jgi:hypothetical protein
MRFPLSLTAAVAALAFVLFSPPAGAAGKPEDELAAAIKIFNGESFATDWSGLEALPGIQWAPLPPASLQNCLPDGGCFSRQGKAMIGGRGLIAVASGARTIVGNLYLRNATAPFGEAAVLAALKGAGLTPELARCPVPGTPGGTNWYRLKGAGASPGVLSIQTSCGGKPCEGFALSHGEDLPALQPAQLKMYSEQCTGAPVERTAVSRNLPHEALAQMIAGIIPPAAGPALSDWNAFAALPSGIEWADQPKAWDLTFKNDPNPFARSGNLTLAGRKFSALASGSPEQAKVLYLEELGMHPRGEHMLGVLYTKGLQVQLARCGPVYTESTNNWYSVKSAGTHPVMLRQSIRYDGNQVQDTYELRLDGTLPKRDPRDRDPGVAGCQ